MSKYPWHPQHRPPSADPSLAAKIALVGPVGKCLETALEELLAEDQSLEVAGDSSDGNGNSDGLDESNDDDGKCTASSKTADASPTRKRKEHDGEGVPKQLSTLSNKQARIDKSIANSILEAYSKSVADTKFDKPIDDKRLNTTYQSSTTTNAIPAVSAPAAMLKGTIDHYNRIGGQWRIVLKPNAILKSRSTTKIDNGLSGRSLRKRMVLDWNDDDNMNIHADADNNETDDVRKRKGSASALNDDGKTGSLDVHRFQGAIQILAYDDDT